MSNAKHEMSRMTSPQVAEYLQEASTVLIPVGSTEQHGPYGPLGTDRAIPEEVCRRVAPKINALMAPALSYALSIPHKGAPGVVYVKTESFMAYVHDILLSLNEGGFRQIVFVNGHWDNGMAINYVIRDAYDQLAPGTLAYCFNYWEAVNAQDIAGDLSWGAGLHANIGETSALLAIDPESVDMEKAVAGWPDPPDDVDPNMVPTMLLTLAPMPSGMVNLTPTGGWGDPTESTAEKGEADLQMISDAVARFITDMEKVHRKMFG
jgi:creatinine amidohydrolase